MGKGRTRIRLIQGVSAERWRRPGWVLTPDRFREEGRPGADVVAVIVVVVVSSRRGVAAIRDEEAPDASACEDHLVFDGQREARGRTMATDQKMVLTVSTKELRATLARMKKLGGGSPGDVILELKPDALVVQWGGMSEELSGQGDVDVIISLPGEAMKGLHRVMPRSDEIRLTYQGERIRFGTLSLKCAVLENKPPMLLPMDASDLDVLMLQYTQDAAEIEATGLDKKLDQIGEKLATSIERAARALDWAGIPEHLLATWVKAHLQARARGEESFEMGARTVVLNEAGQVSLFSDD